VPPLAPDATPQIAIHPDLGAKLDLPLRAQVRRLAAELPDPVTLGSNTWVMVSPGPLATGGFLSQLFARRARTVHLAVRCTALLVRGYVDVCSDDYGMAFGRTP
jgi:hypothetical protein